MHITHRAFSLCLLALILVGTTSCFTPQTLNFYQRKGDANQKLVNNIAKYIIEKGYWHNVVMVDGEGSAAKGALIDKKADVVLTYNSTGPGTAMTENGLMVMGSSAMRPELKELVPEVVEFLSKMKMEQDILDECLSFALDTQANDEETVLFFLANFQSKWKPWVSPSAYEDAKEKMAARVKELKLEF